MFIQYCIQHTSILINLTYAFLCTSQENLHRMYRVKDQKILTILLSTNNYCLWSLLTLHHLQKKKKESIQNYYYFFPINIFTKYTHIMFLCCTGATLKFVLNVAFAEEWLVYKRVARINRSRNNDVVII